MNNTTKSKLIAKRHASPTKRVQARNAVGQDKWDKFIKSERDRRAA